MKSRIRLAAVTAGLIVTAFGVALPAQAGASGLQATTTAAPASGTGQSATASSVNVRSAAAGPQLPAPAQVSAALGRNGKPAGNALPSRPAGGVKPHLANPPGQVGGPNGGIAARTSSARTPFTPPSTVNANFQGMTQGDSNCGNCQPPDVNAAVSNTEIAHVVNLRLQVFTKTGGVLCGVGLNTFLGTGSALSDPRIQYDNLNNRFSMVLIPIPASSSAAPAEYLATSKTADACGSWWVYHMTFSGPSYPAGTLLDYPYLGQDRVSILSSTNNFSFTNSYLGSTAFAVPKSAAYSGAGFSFHSYSVAFSTAPVTVTGKSMLTTTTTYWLASVPGTGYDLYKMPTSPAGAITLQATISSPFSAPPRRVLQPGTSQTLDPLDGRIVWAPVQDDNFVWFSHGMNISGYPGIRYGAINVTSNTATVAMAFHSATSDDFNPSIGVSDAGNGLIHAWLNWAYTDTAAHRPPSDTVNGVLPGQGVPNETGTDLTLVTGSSTSSNFRFGDFSSVAVDPASGGLTAVTAQEYFIGSGLWRTRIARVSFSS